MATSIYIDAETKRLAAQKAKEDKLSFSAVVRILLSDYAEGKIRIGAQTVPHYQFEQVSVDQKTQKQMDSVIKKWRKTKK